VEPLDQMVTDSIFSTITSAGGGGGGRTTLSIPAGNGGSGGGQEFGTSPIGPAGAGNTPPVSPPQGNPGESFGVGAGGGGGGQVEQVSGGNGSI
jgi:hypothetical protein